MCQFVMDKSGFFYKICFQLKINGTLPFPWIIFSQVLWRVDCQDKSFEVSDTIVDVAESTLWYVDKLGTKRAFEKLTPDQVNT